MSVNPRPEPDDGIPSYLNRLTQAPLLTSEEEVALTRAVQNGDGAAKSRLIESNMRLVINIAKGYRNRAIPLEDLIQEGAIGLMQAAERFDPDKGFRFSTYATHWIRQAIGRAIDNKSKAIRLPAHVSQSLRKIEKIKSDLARELGRDPSLDHVARAMGLSAKKLQIIIQSSQELLSLDMTVGDSNGMTLAGLIRDDNVSDPEAKVLDDEALRELHQILSELNEREQRIMRLKYEMPGPDERIEDIETVAQELKLTRERMRQIELQAIKKLKVIALKRRSSDIIGE
jgi:RNA polymerase primary sigma factor